MASPFQHPSAKRLLERLADHFAKGPVWLLPRNQLVFVCGGPVKEGETSVRKKFLSWANSNIDGFHFFVAETAANDVISNDEPKFLNLAQFEEMLAEVADCVVVIPESVGSWAETGLFAAIPRVQKKCLILNCVSKQNDSFLNVGPIQTVNERSNYRPTSVVDFSDEEPAFDVIADKLNRYARRNRRRLEISNFASLQGHEQFALVHYIVSLFPSIDLQSLTLTFKALFTRYRQERIKQLISVLVSTKYLRRVPGDEIRVCAVAGGPQLVEIEGVTPSDLLTEHAEFFEKHAPEFIPVVE